MIKKIFVLLFLCVLFTGCAVKESKVTVKFSTWGSASEMKIIAPIISEFEKENPNIKIELLHIPQDYFKKLHLLFASNMAPDVVFINNLNLPVYSKFLYELDDYVDKKQYYSQSIEAMSIDKCLYAIPRDVSTLVIYYNKDLFKKYGVTPPNKNWTIEDLLTISKKLTKEHSWGMSYEPKMLNAFPFINYLEEGELNEITNQNKGIIFYNKLAYGENVAPKPSQVGSKTLAQLFLEEKIAMHLSGRWMVPKYRECARFDWDVVNFPKYKATSDSSGWAVVKQSKNKDAAIRFILFLSDKHNISKMTADGLIVPARRDVAESSVFLDGIPKHSNMFIESVKYSTPTKVTKNYNKIVDKLNNTVFSFCDK